MNEIRRIHEPEDKNTHTLSLSYTHTKTHSLTHTLAHAHTLSHKHTCTLSLYDVRQEGGDIHVDAIFNMHALSYQSELTFESRETQ